MSKTLKQFRNFIICAVLSGCGHLTFHRAEDSPGPIPEGSAQNYTINALLFGAIPLNKIPLENELCPTSRIDTLTMHMNGSQVLLAIVTLGIYTPHDVRVVCSHYLGV